MVDRGILDSWKEISVYLDRSQKPCQRWENEYALPVHRLDGSPKARVFAYKDEIDRWKSDLARNKKTSTRSSHLWIVAVVVIALVLPAIIYITRSGSNSYKQLSLAVPQPFLAEPGIREESPVWNPSGDLVAF